jgi:hypothetical protein
VVDLACVSVHERIAFTRQMFGNFATHEYVAWQVRHELAEFDRELTAFLESPAGRFAVYYAQHDRRRRER